MTKQEKNTKMYNLYGNFVQVPYTWYGLCKKYIIPKNESTDKESIITINPMEINILAYFANYKECFICNGSIAEVFHVSKKTVEKYMKELRLVGFIKTFQERDDRTYTTRRYIHVQHDLIQCALNSDSNPYRVVYKLETLDDMISDVYREHNLQIEPVYPTDVSTVSDKYGTNNNKKEYIRIDNNNDAEDKSPALASDEALVASDDAPASADADAFAEAFPMKPKKKKDEKAIYKSEFSTMTDEKVEREIDYKIWEWRYSEDETTVEELVDEIVCHCLCEREPVINYLEKVLGEDEE